jgi:hypothetical protein
MLSLLTLIIQHRDGRVQVQFPARRALGTGQSPVTLRKSGIRDDYRWKFAFRYETIDAEGTVLI